METSAVRTSRQPTSASPPPCYLFKFPNELLAETVSWLQHPIEILFLSETCKKLYNYLRDPTTSYVWRQVREDLIVIADHAIRTPSGPQMIEKLVSYNSPTSRLKALKVPGEDAMIYLKVVQCPIPAPFDGMTEYAYARMLFGLKRCDVCGTGYYGSPWSFSIAFSMCKVCRERTRPGNTLLLREARKVLADEMKGISIPADEFWPALWASVPREHPLYLAEEDEDEDDWGGWSIRFEPYTSSELWKSRIEELKQKVLSQDTKTFVEITLKRRAERLVAVHKHANVIKLWYRTYRIHEMEIRECIEESAVVFGASKGLPLEDMEKSKIYIHTLAKAVTLNMVEMVSLLNSNILNLKRQTLEIQANRISESKNLAKQTRRKEIEAFYKSFEFEGGVKPCLDTFRNFPILQALQRGIAGTVTRKRVSREMSTDSLEEDDQSPVYDTTSISRALKRRMVLELVQTSLGEWRMNAATGARKLLGFETVVAKPKTKKSKKKKETMDITDGTAVEDVPQSAFPVPSTSTTTSPQVSSNTMNGTIGIWNSTLGKLDPELRVTSWFICTRCTNIDPPYKRMRVLDFRGICAHVCWEKDRSRSQQRSWKIGIFALAPRAMDTARKMLELLQLDPEDPRTEPTCLKGWWTCNHCPEWMNAMAWEDLLRHCQRHATQNIARVSEKEARKRREVLRICEKQLTFADLLSGNHESHALTKQFACIHCRPAPSTNGGPSNEPNRPEKTMDIHGIRQHLKAKHHVEDCRNEDFYYVESALIQLPSKEIKPARQQKRKNGKSTPRSIEELLGMRR